MQISDNDYTWQISTVLTRKNTQNNTLNFGSKLFPFSGETANYKTQLTKNKHTHEQDTHIRNKNQYIQKYKYQINKP